ncbi:MAG: hypothetical protein CYPHOPRED_003394 [Cyphobasidiales sp. Tagirdzhanova-0007]|nr:MAG: hypothetical protein CYPHOPRED_003394 [Cyphobasidiales sp. Tagirdzhanova-0007]
MSLKFKGEKLKKKRVHKELEGQDDEGEGSSTESMRTRYGKDPEGWVLGLDALDFCGPLFITSKSILARNGQPLALSANPINYKVYPFVLAADMTAETGEPVQIDSIWRCTRVPESEDKITLRSAQDRYLACDQVGSISADREARGAEEEFIFVSKQETHGKGAYAMQSAAWDKYLAMDEVAGGKLELRCDSETIGDEQIWYIKMQAEYLGKMEEERRRKQRKMGMDDGLIIVGDLKGAENANILKYQARGAGRIVGSAESKKELRKAQQEGRLAEEMLNRRMKLKSDRYC